jgi:hypothetical protein
MKRASTHSNREIKSTVSKVRIHVRYRLPEMQKSVFAIPKTVTDARCQQSGGS